MTESKESLFAKGAPGRISLGRTVSTFTAARMIGISPNTVLALIYEGKLSAFRNGARGHWRITYDSVVTYIAGLQAQAAGELPPPTRSGL